MFTLLQRYVLSELLKVFGFSLSALTILLMFIGVIGEAMKKGLGPVQILQILPYVVPSLLPFTVPATLLLTVCVVYGRLSADQELTAVKAAGINIMSMIWPSIFLGGVLSVCTLILTDQFIPWARGNIQKTITAAMEDIFLDMLRTKGNIDDLSKGYSITVMGVEGKQLIRPTFRYVPAGKNAITITADRALLSFDVENQEIVLQTWNGHMQVPGSNFSVRWAKHDVHRIPLVSDKQEIVPREMTVETIQREISTVAGERSLMEQRRLLDTAILLTHGDFERFSGPEFNHYRLRIQSSSDRINRLNTEIHSRYALSCSCLFFVILGSPFSILQGKKQFLTSFFLCFMPILLLYYPLVLLCINLAKTNGNFDPLWTMWSGNLILLAFGLLVIRRLTRN
ncbi:MAG: LptF/LptG family permease [Planctomycetaceae bacterium]|nr:LptF/LptG family permease [Planctomycetaceae bacterium]